MSQKEFADTIFTGGNIFTMDDAKPKCEAVAVKGDTILAVGRKDDVFKFSGPSTTVIDLEGKTMFPGFIEPHQHAIQAAIFSILPSISGYECFSYAEVKARIMKGISAVDPSQSPLGWGVTFGWDPELVRDLPALDAKFIAKEFSADIPVLIVAQNGHAAWCNHKAFEVAGIDSSVQDSSDAVYGREEDGSLSGEVWESGAILGLLSKMPKSPDADPKKLLTDQWKAYASYGFTTVTELAYTPNPPVDEIVVKMSHNKDCPIRLGLYQLVGEISDVDDDSCHENGCCDAESSDDGNNESGTLADDDSCHENGCCDAESSDDGNNESGTLADDDSCHENGCCDAESSDDGNNESDDDSCHENGCCDAESSDDGNNESGTLADDDSCHENGCCDAESSDDGNNESGTLADDDSCHENGCCDAESSDDGNNESGTLADDDSCHENGCCDAESSDDGNNESGTFADDDSCHENGCCDAESSDDVGYYVDGNRVHNS
ncbi:predicted protein [Nematostella vectensis]|uniref:Amidohydrolase 3 domain-containing protein n=1 Tax=Nematostella vectensis TaxID=45351 RepID=A7STY4_NEMVE|nr:predicted protein [Nematostella vectensis]|eukprot:XP_001624933.1 predicted protein [Nematostella vectensis]